MADETGDEEAQRPEDRPDSNRDDRGQRDDADNPGSHQVSRAEALLHRTTRRSWVVWTVALVAYIIAVFDRTSLGVVAEQATARFGIGASQFSLFVVTQLLVYALMQVPTGVLLDRFGPRIMIVVGGLVMAIGQLTIAHATGLETAIGARILVGAGDAMTFISVLRLIPAWFSPLRVPLLTQVTGQVGQLGQVLSAVPLTALLATAGWTVAYSGAAAIGVLGAILVLVVVRDRPASAARPEVTTDLRLIWHGLVASFTDPGTRLGLWTHFTSQFSAMVFLMMWGYPFLTLGLGLPAVTAGSLITLVVIGSVISGPILGRLTASYPMRRSNLVLIEIGLTIVVWTVVLAWPGAAPLWLIIVLMAVLGANGPTSMIGFDFARSFNPAARLGGATGIVNMGGFVATLTTIFLIGLVLDLRGGGYTLTDFKIALSTQYLVWAFGLFAIVRTRVLTRRRYGAPGDHLHQAVVRRWRGRRPRR